MQVNKDLTIKFYQTYSPCNCGDCKYIIRHIEREQPEICNYLESLGVNPLKPYELMSVYFDKEKKIEYLDCAYVVLGKKEEDFDLIINDIKVSSCSKERYPLLDIDQEYFLISFGPMCLNNAYLSNRHISFSDKVNIIKKAIDEVDPMCLLSFGAPKNEYLQEANLIASHISDKKIFLGYKTIQNIFKSQFDQLLPKKICQDISQRIGVYLDVGDVLVNFEEEEIFKGKVSIENCTIILKVHDNFVVECLGGKTKINGKFYDCIEDEDLMDCLSGFVQDDAIYVQYKHKHVGFHLHQPRRYFAKIKRSKYSFSKLRHKKDLELIFDNKKVLYNSSDALLI